MIEVSGSLVQESMVKRLCSSSSANYMHLQCGRLAEVLFDARLEVELIDRDAIPHHIASPRGVVSRQPPSYSTPTGPGTRDSLYEIVGASREN